MKGRGGEDLSGTGPAEQGGSMTETPLDTSSAGLLVNGWDAAFCPHPVPTQINGRRMAYGGFLVRRPSPLATRPPRHRPPPAANQPPGPPHLCSTPPPHHPHPPPPRPP